MVVSHGRIVLFRIEKRPRVLAAAAPEDSLEYVYYRRTVFALDRKGCVHRHRCAAYLARM